MIKIAVVVLILVWVSAAACGGDGESSRLLQGGPKAREELGRALQGTGTPIPTPEFARTETAKVGTTISRTSVSPNGVHTFDVRFEMGHTYNIEMEGAILTTEMGRVGVANLVLLGTDGETELDWDSTTGDGEYKIVFQAPRSGIYTVRVEGIGDKSWDYKLHIQTEDVPLRGFTEAVEVVLPASSPRLQDLHQLQRQPDAVGQR